MCSTTFSKPLGISWVFKTKLSKNSNLWKKLGLHGLRKAVVKPLFYLLGIRMRYVLLSLPGNNHIKVTQVLVFAQGYCLVSGWIHGISSSLPLWSLSDEFVRGFLVDQGLDHNMDLQSSEHVLGNCHLHFSFPSNSKNFFLRTNEWWVTFFSWATRSGGTFVIEKFQVTTLVTLNQTKPLTNLWFWGFLIVPRTSLWCDLR